MSNVIAFEPKQRRDRSARGLPLGHVVYVGFYGEHGTQRFGSIDAAVRAIREALDTGCVDFAVGVRPLPPDEIEPEHAR
jgi:hypothetical protein